MPEGVRGSNGLVGFLGVLIAGGVLDWFLGEVLVAAVLLDVLAGRLHRFR